MGREVVVVAVAREGGRQSSIGVVMAGELEAQQIAEPWPD
jgi:hypothetical protein